MCDAKKHGKGKSKEGRSVEGSRSVGGERHEPVEVEWRCLRFGPGREVLDRGGDIGERAGDLVAGRRRGGVEGGQGGVGGSLAFFKPRTSRHAQFALECGAAHVRMYSLHEARAVLLQ